MEVRCCCKPNNIIGFLPRNANLPIRELNDGTMAFSSEGRDDIVSMEGFKSKHRKDGKTWKK